MKKKNEKVVIIGAGPVGCYLGRLLKRKGVDSLLLEEHKELGKPVHCAGLVGRKVFEELQIPFSKKSIINTIDEGRVWFNGDSLLLKRKGVAYVINREEFDKQLGDGLSINFETKFVGLEKTKKGYLIETDKGEVEADIVVGADGTQSNVRKFLVSKKINYLTGVQFRIETELFNIQRVEVYFKKPYFYWVIPERENIVRVGVLSKNPYQDLLGFLAEKKIKGNVLEKYAGTVPLTHFFPIAKGKIFLVGDSASQIKPLTYGGVYMGMRAAEILADCIISGRLPEYSSGWESRYKREIKISLAARKIFQELSEKELKKLFSLAKKHSTIIEKKGDFEKHTLLLKEFMKEAVLSKDVLFILLKIIRAGI